MTNFVELFEKLGADVREYVSERIAEVKKQVDELYDLMRCQPPDIEAIVKAAVAGIPDKAHIKDEIDAAGRGIQYRIEQLEEKIRNVSTQKGDPGPEGRPGVSPDPESIIAAVLSRIPTPRDGTNGKDGISPDVRAIVAEVLSQIPTPRDGRDGREPDFEAIVAAVLSRIPKPERGADGKDGKTPDIEPIISAVLDRVPKQPEVDAIGIIEGVTNRLSGMVHDLVATAVAALPRPRDGQDGKDGTPGRDGRDGTSFEHSVLTGMVDAAAVRAVAAMPVPKDGKDGRDAENVNIADVGGELVGRDLKLRFLFAGGAEKEISLRLTGIAIYQSVFASGHEYERGDMVTHDGSVWHCEVERTRSTPGKGNKDWKLAVKRGNDGKDGAKGDTGETGAPGRDLRYS